MSASSLSRTAAARALAFDRRVAKAFKFTLARTFTSIKLGPPFAAGTADCEGLGGLPFSGLVGGRCCDIRGCHTSLGRVSEAIGPELDERRLLQTLPTTTADASIGERRDEFAELLGVGACQRGLPVPFSVKANFPFKDLVRSLSTFATSGNLSERFPVCRQTLGFAIRLSKGAALAEHVEGFSSTECSLDPWPIADS